ncbi:hypothetical protein LCGC14_0581730 [marine sediment metagenome]|uniref:Uncharacterized protein n=1 Tax=marine sediment metagenome TaxID=412755 RepID=A0A0F9UPG4_9ZZZZ
MPYIDKSRRLHLDCGHSPKTAGELNYLITMTAVEYLESNGESYQSYNDILGALEGAKLELYRRRIAAYEELKIDQNGDVY